MRQQQTVGLGLAVLLMVVTAPLAEAHFGMVIPSTPLVSPAHKSVDLTLSFSHPFEGIGMDLAKPSRFYVVGDEGREDLLNTLAATKVMDYQAWHTSYRVKRPGVYQFVMEPTPYWEPAEDLSIIHYTKTIVAAYGADSGWHEPVGLPTEIIPLLRPFANYSGNSFSGQVLMNGKPVPHAEVEVEFYNEEGRLEPVSDYHITQVIRADGAGIFTFTCPLPGWWGFSALAEADYTLADPDGQAKPVELGAVLWIRMDAYRSR